MEIRGILGTSIQLFFNFGILYSYIMGSFIESLFWFNCTGAILPLIFLVIFSFMPESPYYLMKIGNEMAALEALTWLRGPKYDSRRELNEIKGELEDKNERPSLKKA
jgi:SP family galactose:H+ symporter-like MFS transporter